MDNRKLFIAIPTWQRYQQTIDSFKEVLHDARVEKIIITDDCSQDGSYEKLKEYFKNEDKVVLFENEKNIDCYFCKHQTVVNYYGDCGFGIILDSDNKIDKSYLDAIYAIPEWDVKTIYLPEFAKPYFSAKQWSGLIITKENVAQYAGTNLMTNLNAFNLFINRNEYLEVWDGSVDPITSDSIYFSYCWLNSGRKILVTPNLEYDHYISPKNDGHYMQNYKRAVSFHEVLMNKIKQLK